jgi:lipoprotein-anchoring transpeptidase ErfK/SrfK
VTRTNLLLSSTLTLLLLVPFGVTGQSTATTSAQTTDTASVSDSQTSPVTDDRPAPPSKSKTKTEAKKPAAPKEKPVAKPAEPTGPLNLLASLKQRTLYVAIGQTPIRKFPVAIGAKKHPTPQGLFGIQHIVWNPSWHPPDAKWAKGKQAKKPGDPDNPMRVVKIFFQEPDYYIHGTLDEDSLGAAASHGCLRMSESDAATLARLIMERGGAPKPEAWHDKVAGASSSADVKLPRPVPFRIAP